MKIDIAEVEEQIYKKRKNVRYDIRDLTVEMIVNKYISTDEDDGAIDVDILASEDIYNGIYIPEYQRDFTWDDKRQSKLIESVILGLPIPFIFFAEGKDSRWEIVDGSQRVRTLHNFVKCGLRLNNLESLDSLNGYSFDELESARKGKILNTALRVIVLDEETTEDIKKDMFERINLGSDLLKPMEKRKGIFPGLFTEFIYEYCSSNERFVPLDTLDKWLVKRQEREELLLRFFALSENNVCQKGISGGLSTFLDKYLKETNLKLDSMNEIEKNEYLFNCKNKIDKVVDFVSLNFPSGFRSGKNPQTKRSVYEAISIGTLLFLDSDLRTRKAFDKEVIDNGLKSPELKQFTGANKLHQKQKLGGRTQFVFNLIKESLL